VITLKGCVTIGLPLCIDYAKRCEACKFHANFIHQHPESLHLTVASWPFEAWVLDVLGSITPKSFAGQSYILMVTNHFSKWVEAIPLREVKKENIADFIQTTSFIATVFLDTLSPIMANHLSTS